MRSPVVVLELVLVACVAAFLFLPLRWGSEERERWIGERLLAVAVGTQVAVLGAVVVELSLR